MGEVLAGSSLRQDHGVVEAGRDHGRSASDLLEERGQLWGPTKSLLLGSWSPPEMGAAQPHWHQVLLLLLLVKSVS